MNISLIICTRNRREILIQNLSLFADQFCDGDEIIIVDSSDEPQNIGCENFRFIKSIIRYYHTSPGLPLQRNYGIDKAKKSLVMFLDDDIYLFPDVLKQIRVFFEKHIDIAAVTGALSEKVLPSKGMRTFQYLFGKLFFTSYFGRMALTPGGLPVLALDNERSHLAKFLRGGFSVYRKNVFDRIRFDEYFTDYAYLEDTDFSIQFNQYYKAYFLDCFRGFHAHESTKNQDQSKYRKQYVLNYVYIYRKFSLGSIFKLNWVLCGLLIVNVIKSLIENNSSFYKGTLQGIKQVRKNVSR